MTRLSQWLIGYKQIPRIFRGNPVFSMLSSIFDPQNSISVPHNTRKTVFLSGVDLDTHHFLNYIRGTLNLQCAFFALCFFGNCKLNVFRRLTATTHSVFGAFPKRMFRGIRPGFRTHDALTRSVPQTTNRGSHSPYAITLQLNTQGVFSLHMVRSSKWLGHNPFTVVMTGSSPARISKWCLRLTGQDASLSSRKYRVRIPQASPYGGIVQLVEQRSPKNMLITRQMIFPNQVRSSNAAGF